MVDFHEFERFWTLPYVLLIQFDIVWRYLVGNISLLPISKAITLQEVCFPYRLDMFGQHGNKNACGQCQRGQNVEGYELLLFVQHSMGNSARGSSLKRHEKIQTLFNFHFMWSNLIVCDGFCYLFSPRRSSNLLYPEMEMGISRHLIGDRRILGSNNISHTKRLA